MRIPPHTVQWLLDSGIAHETLDDHARILRAILKRRMPMMRRVDVSLRRLPDEIMCAVALAGLPDFHAEVCIQVLPGQSILHTLVDKPLSRSKSFCGHRDFAAVPPHCCMILTAGAFWIRDNIGNLADLTDAMATWPLFTNRYRRV